MPTEAIIAGLVSGIVSPLVLGWLQHKYIWRRQRSLEIRHSVFQDSVRALSLWASDALDPELQAKNAEQKGLKRIVALRPETVELLERSKGMVRAFFSPAAFEAFRLVLHSNVSLENIPNEDFEKNRTYAILALAKELDE